MRGPDPPSSALPSIETSQARGPSRARLVFAGMLVVGLTALVTLVALRGGEEGVASLDPADEECLEAWNEDPAQVSFGVHQATGHGYGSVEVERLNERGEPVEGEAGDCAVAFAAQALDPEPGAAAQVFDGRRWRPVSDLPDVSTGQLGILQSNAVSGANATLASDGTLAAR